MWQCEAHRRLLRVCSCLSSLHGKIRAYGTGTRKEIMGASAYAVHMKEAREWTAAFRPFYVMGGVPPEFQGGLQPPLQHHMPLPNKLLLCGHLQCLCIA